MKSEVLTLMDQVKGTVIDLDECLAAEDPNALGELERLEARLGELRGLLGQQVVRPVLCSRCGLSCYDFRLEPDGSRHCISCIDEGAALARARIQAAASLLARAAQAPELPPLRKGADA